MFVYFIFYDSLFVVPRGGISPEATFPDSLHKIPRSPEKKPTFDKHPICAFGTLLPLEKTREH